MIFPEKILVILIEHIDLGSLLNHYKKLLPEDLHVDKVRYLYSKKIILSFLQRLLPSRLTSQFFIKLTKKMIFQFLDPISGFIK